MSKSKALELAIMLAERTRDELARRHAQAHQTLQFAQGQLDQLSSYASSTDARWVGGQSLLRSVELLRHHYQFTERLQHAMQQQHGVIAHLERQTQRAHQQMLQAECRLSGLRQVQQQRVAAEQALQHRREQRITDAFAAMRHFRNQAAQALEETP